MIEKVMGLWGGGFLQWKKKEHLEYLLAEKKLRQQELMKFSVENVYLLVRVQRIILNPNAM